MANQWKDVEIAWIQKVTKDEPSTFQVDILTRLQDVLDGGDRYTEQAHAIAMHMYPEENRNQLWVNFLVSFISAAMSSSDDQAQQRLFMFLEALTIEPDINIGPPPLRFNELPYFDMLMEEMWINADAIRSRYEMCGQATDAWAKINIFLANLSGFSHRRAPIIRWPEEYGLWTISEGLEDDDKVTINEF